MPEIVGNLSAAHERARQRGDVVVGDRGGMVALASCGLKVEGGDGALGGGIPAPLGAANSEEKASLPPRRICSFSTLVL